MKKDFTYVDDIVYAITNLKNKVPNKSDYIKNSNSSSVAPFRIINVGNSKTIELLHFIKILEKKLNKKAKIKFMDLQKGDVVETLSDVNHLEELIGERRTTDISTGITKFLNWYLNYYKTQ